MTQEHERFLFPYEKIREVQDKLLEDIQSCLKNKQNLVAHAPTGLGKTVSVLGPALNYAMEKKMTVFFLTSRHTQHRIAIETLKEIQDKFKLKFSVVDLIGKKWMCPVDHIKDLYSSEFYEYCKKQREENKCEFYKSTKTGAKATEQAKKALKKIKSSIFHTEELLELGKKERLCPYELAAMAAKDASVVITDYYYIFNSHIRNSFFKRAEKELSSSIIIIDEGHNLPERMRELNTEKLSTIMIKNSLKEAKKYGYSDIVAFLSDLQDILIRLSEPLRQGQEKLLPKELFLKLVKEIGDIDEMSGAIEEAAETVRATEQRSYLAGIWRFLAAWNGPDEGYARILSFTEYKSQPITTIAYRCLDPSLTTKEVIGETHSTIIMSGTLTPTDMYRNLMGFPDNTIEKIYTNPFPQKNRLNLVVPLTTTKYNKRDMRQFQNQAAILSEITSSIPGNSAVFFPSYNLLANIRPFFKSDKKLIAENPGMEKKEKHDMLERFKKEKTKGAVLFAATSGSFGEGIDLPGDFLNGVIVVGIPLNRPDLETEELIKYYDKKFGMGWDYGYLFPAFTKIMQNAGRCIRSETDKGAIIFLDERYTWPNYFRCFPPDWNIKISRNYKKEIEDFFAAE